jgi:phytoene dehydrogenase-like protein
MWDEKTKEEYADRVFSLIDQYAPGFKQSVIFKDVLAPPDLERVFGLTGTCGPVKRTHAHTPQGVPTICFRTMQAVTSSTAPWA